MGQVTGGLSLRTITSFPGTKQVAAQGLDKSAQVCGRLQFRLHVLRSIQERQGVIIGKGKQRTGICER